MFLGMAYHPAHWLESGGRSTRGCCASRIPEDWVEPVLRTVAGVEVTVRARGGHRSVLVLNHNAEIEPATIQGVPAHTMGPRLAGGRDGPLGRRGTVSEC
jgi:hypothetical protein